jgi:hypothetical protein
VAPVWPALKSAAASPRATTSAATRIDARDFLLSAAAGASHPDDIAGLDEAHSIRVVMHSGELSRDPVSRTDEHHTKIEMTGCRHRARDDGSRRKVAAEGVDRDPDHSSLTARA